MRVMERWPALLRCEEFYELLATPELDRMLMLGRKLFGHLPAVRSDLDLLDNLCTRWAARRA